MVAIRETPQTKAEALCLPDNEPKSEQNKLIGLEELVHGILQQLKSKLSLFVWQGFFETLVPISFVDQVLTVAAPSTFHKDWVSDHYQQELMDIASELCGQKIKIAVIDKHFETGQVAKKPKEKRPEQLDCFEKDSVKAKPSPTEVFEMPRGEVSITPLRAPIENRAHVNFKLESNPFNEKYSFESFVPGPSNQMAFAACSAIAEQTSAQFSPLFLFGPVGIGKTHLIHAIGHASRLEKPNVNIVYMSAEQWVNAYIQAIRERKFDAFRKKFRSGCDILLIDDIQFLAGKDASQDEFFHTFNSLHQAKKQIVVTSDKYPHEIEGLEERLRTRLSWGLVADIRPPEIETRIAILHKKAEILKVNLSNEVAYYLASQVSSSVRELEGALLRLSVFLKVTNSEITLDRAKEYLAPVFKKESTKKTSPQLICSLVAKYYSLTSQDLLNKSRQQPVALARQVAMFLCRTLLTSSLPEIGRYFGGRDHSTVLSSVRKIDGLRKTDVGLQVVLSRLEKEVFLPQTRNSRT